MSSEFLESLDLDERVYCAGNLIVVHENGRGDGGFVEHFIVADFLRRFGRENCRVCLVLTHQSELHWASIAGKVGWNLQASKEKGQVVTIDLVKEAYNKLVCSEEIGSTLPDSGLINSSNGSIDLEKLFENISHFSSSGDSKSSGRDVKVKQLIVIEDLSSLLYQSEGSSPSEQNSAEKNLMEFIWKLRNFSKTRETSLLTSVNSAEESGDAVGTRFAKLVAQVLGQVSIQVSPLSTGFSPQISGYLTTRSKINGAPKWVKSNHYKLEDRHIRVTPLA